MSAEKKGRCAALREAGSGDMRNASPTTAYIRKDDGRLVIETTEYVSHRQARGPWKSSFSMTIEEAIFLRDRIDASLAARAKESQS